MLDKKKNKLRFKKYRNHNLLVKCLIYLKYYENFQLL